MTPKEARITGVILFIVFMVVIVLMGIGINGCMKNMIAKTEAMKIQNEHDAAEHKIYRARLPKAGDRVVLNDSNVSVVKEYVFSRKFKVRYDNGTMADVAETEMLDLEIIKNGDKNGR